MSFQPTMRMSHEEERVNGAGMQQKPERAPPHWLNPLVGPTHVPLAFFSASTMRKLPGVYAPM